MFNTGSEKCEFNPKMIDFQSKDKLFNYHIRNMLKKCLGMFEYKKLPKEISPRVFEWYLQNNGLAIMFEEKGKHYVSFGYLGGVPDFNYQPTVATVANPFLKISKQLKIDWGYEVEIAQNTDGDCVVIPNDSSFYGLLPTHTYYASQLVENDLTLNCLLINTRLMNILIAGDDDAKQSLDEVIEDLYNGKISTAMSDNWIMDAIKSVPFGENGSSSNIVQLLEERQYIKGSWWNELGVQSNYNMKRETITSSENILNIDSLLPITDDMYNMRKKYIDICNEKFGLEIEFDYSSAWKKIRDEFKLKELLQLKELQQSNQLDKKGEDNKSNQLDEKVEDKGGEDNVEEKED